MPAATLEQRRQNLTRLLGAISPHCKPDAERESADGRQSLRIPLTHAVRRSSLLDILASEALLSQAQIGARVGHAETILETADDVFLYIGSFGYPETEFGFLFQPTLEESHRLNGISTPFDSGAFATCEKVKPPAAYTNGTTFVKIGRAHV